ncbi:hypothetical protein FALCPG4_001845 [Fusarium falciforme]
MFMPLFTEAFTSVKSQVDSDPSAKEQQKKLRRMVDQRKGGPKNMEGADVEAFFTCSSPLSFGNSYIYSIHEQDGGSSTIPFYCPQPHLTSFTSPSSLTMRSLPS